MPTNELSRLKGHRKEEKGEPGSEEGGEEARQGEKELKAIFPIADLETKLLIAGTGDKLRKCA